MRAEIVIEKLCSVTFNLRAIKQVVTVPQGQKLVITKMKNIEESGGGRFSKLNVASTQAQ